MNATANVVNGVAAFNDLTIDSLSGSFTLAFTYGSLSTSWGPVVVSGSVCAGCGVFIPVRSYSPTFGPFANGSSQLGIRVLTQLRRLVKWTQRDMRPGFSNVAKLTIRIYGFAGIGETSQPEMLALERAKAVASWIKPRIGNLNKTSMPVRYLITRETVQPSLAISHKVTVVLKLGS